MKQQNNDSIRGIPMVVLTQRERKYEIDGEMTKNENFGQNT